MDEGDVKTGGREIKGSDRAREVERAREAERLARMFRVHLECSRH